MSDLPYQQFISEFCDCIGVSDWQQVARNGHLEIDGKTVGLIHSTSPGAARWLSVYVDLGPIPAPLGAKIHRAMLVANLSALDGLDGTYGLHPLTGNGVYYLRHAMDQSPLMLANRLDMVFKHVLSQYRALGF